MTAAELSVASHSAIAAAGSSRISRSPSTTGLTPARRNPTPASCSTRVGTVVVACTMPSRTEPYGCQYAACRTVRSVRRAASTSVPAVAGSAATTT